MANPGRNDPCPCGSGKKFKRCCGVDGAQTLFNRAGLAQQKPVVNAGGSDAGQPGNDFASGRLEAAQRLFILGNGHAAQGRIDQAIRQYECALSIRPDYAEVHNNLGNARKLQGQTDRAIKHYERAVSLRSDYVEAHINLGLALAAQGRNDRAILHYERALELWPNDAEIHNSLGLALAAQDRIGQAIFHYERALELLPDHAETHNNLGIARAMQGRADRAMIHYERALSLRPDCARTYSNLLFNMNYTSDKDPAFVFTAHLDFARRREASSATSIETPARDRPGGRRLRLGYVSSDFRQHSVSYFIEPVLAHHDHERFEIFCYSNHPHEDSVTGRLKPLTDHWRHLVGRSDEWAAQQIRADQIDILVDLNGHTAKNRLPLFASRPAPVQVTWLGYPNTTGLSAMDYRITDGFADPVGLTEHLHSEELVRLPECFSCYQPPREATEVSGLPAHEKGYVTFGSFNNMAKITSEVRAVWARVLQAIPGSRLTLKNPALSDGPTRQTVRKMFEELGITPDRLELLGRDQSQRDHLDQYRNIDIGLDPFPYNGATTTCEALWMGVPVVTLAGKTHAGRVGVSQLSNLGLTELVSHTVEEYISIARRLAADLERLSCLRRELRASMAASPLTDGQRFTKHLEQAYLVMWQNWCRRTFPQQAPLPDR